MEVADIAGGAASHLLLSPAAVRRHAHALLEVALADGLAEWRVDLARLPYVADFTAQEIRRNYPGLDIPFHSRWRHFVVDRRDLWAERAKPSDRQACARVEFDLVIPSVLLDAGAGGTWRYHDRQTGLAIRRSEGLAIASLRLFEAGGLSADPSDPLRADALERVDAALLAQAFQVDESNPLPGLHGRAALLRRLGEIIGRPSALFDILARLSHEGRLSASTIVEILLDVLGPIWPGRPILAGVPLGDCWPHPAVGGLVPLHKLSQWMAYSLIEPLERSGIRVTNIDTLTGLAEYRNGGLFVDLGVLVLRNPADAVRSHPVGGPLVVGWRSLTVALIDRLAPMVRDRLGMSADELPLPRLLQGGTWAAGRTAARDRRPDGRPPIKIISDGTVF